MPVKLELGMMVRDNDPRDPGRVMVIHCFDGERAILRRINAQNNRMGETRVKLSRIHTDGKPRRSGWSVVK